MVETRAFPDGESLVRVEGPFRHAVVYRSLNDPGLHDPNTRLVEALLAASALRDQGAERLILVAPYLSYLRQDTAFRPGEAVSQKVVGRLIAEAFDGVVSVDPHLHRTRRLADIFPGVDAVAVSAAPALASLVRQDGFDKDTILIGPDQESRSQVAAVAAILGLEWEAAEKVRRGDRAVTVRLPAATNCKGRPVILVDDVISTGTTLMECARLLREKGAARIEALAVHALYAPDREDAFRAAGIAQVRCTDSLAHPAGRAPLAGLLAEAVKLILGGSGADRAPP